MLIIAFFESMIRVKMLNVIKVSVVKLSVA